ncbi:MAG: bifunctional phosphoglucose/phosphomannose isomerase [Anaerolineae bacterium]
MTDDASRDPGGMMDAVRGLPDQLAAAWARSRDFELPEGYDDVDSVVLAGMGGSAIGGDLAASLLADTLAVPMATVRDYVLPGWVGPRTLVIGSSFSGNTEETLAAYRAASEAGALRVTVSTGGALTEMAHQAGDPVLAMPAGGQPRAALGNSLASVLRVLYAARLIDDPSDRITDAAAGMADLVAEQAAAAGDHPVDDLAAALVEPVGVVYAPADMAPVALRWKAQLNENSKVTAAFDVLPELNHNAVVGYDGPGDVGGVVRVVVLDGPRTHPRVQRRIEITTGLLQDCDIPFSVVQSPGRGSRFAEALWLVQYGDLVSVELAFLRGVDPTPVDTIRRLKAALA